MIELPKWQSDLVDRMNANDFKLFNLREQHWLVLSERIVKHEPGSIAWVQYRNHIAKIQDRIRDVLDDIRFTRQLWFIGPIIGDTMALPIGYGGRTLIQIIKDEIEKLDSGDHDMNASIADNMARGMEKALDILENPKNYLTTEERNEWITAQVASKKIIRPSGISTQHQDHQARKSTTEPTVKEARRQTVTVVRRKKNAD